MRSEAPADEQCVVTRHELAYCLLTMALTEVMMIDDGNGSTVIC